MKKIFFITSTLPLEHGGRTKSLLQRARIFTENNVKVKIHTTNYNENYHYVYKKFLKDGRVNQNIELSNIYDYYKEGACSQKRNYKMFLKKELKKYEFFLTTERNIFEEIVGKFRSGVKVEDTTPIYKLKKRVDSQVIYYYKDGRTLYHLSKNEETNKIKNIDFYLPYYKKSVMRAYTDNRENVHKVRYFHPDTDKIQADVFLDSEFKPYIIKEYSYKNNAQKLDRIILTRKNSEANVFKTEKEFFNFWFEEIFSDGDIVINDARLLDKPLLETNKEIKRIFQLHNSHLENPIDPDSNVKGSFRSLLQQNFKETDIIVALTYGQKQNILKRYPNLNKNIVVIPHSIVLNEIKYSLNKKQICIVARLAPQKRLQDAIEAFRQFSERVEGYTLVIYGQGEEEDKLQKFISEKGLEANVKLMGVTNHPERVFQESIFSVVSSIHEGFALTVLESIANGCPAISYNVMWGPSELLDENSGRITKDNTPDALCHEMLEEVNNPKDRSDVCVRAKKFSVVAFYDAWSQLI